MERSGLEREPLVDHQRIAREPRVEGCQRPLALGPVETAQRHQCALPVGHVVRRVELRLGAALGFGGIGGGQVNQRLGLQLACAACLRGEAVGDRGAAIVQRAPLCAEVRAEKGFQSLAGGVDFRGLVDHQLLGQVGLARQNEKFAAHQVVELRVGEHRRKRLADRQATRIDCRARDAAVHGADQVLHHQLLQCLVARERIVVVPGEEQQVLGGRLGGDRDRGREPAIERQHRRCVEACESEGLLGAVEHQQFLAAIGAAGAVEQCGA